MNVALYCRVSTEEQARHGISIKAQLNELREYAKAHKYTVIGEYKDEGVSGGLLDRPALNCLLEDVKLGKINTIIFVKLDRWFRSVAHYYKIQEVLDKYQVNWIATQEDYETITSSGKFKVNIMLSVSQQFKDATSERIKSVFDYKVGVKKEVLSGKHIFGYDIVDKHYVINEEEAEIIRNMFDIYIKTNSTAKVREYMEEATLFRGHDWAIRRLKCKFYIGEYEYKGKVYYDYFPQIVDIDIYNQVQSMIKNNKQYFSNRTGTQNEYIFRGLLQCPNCGRVISTCSGGIRKHGTYKYYRCRHNDLGFIIPEKELEEYLLTNIENKTLKIIESNTKNKKSDIPKIKKQLQTLVDLLMDNLIDKEEYTKRYSQLKKKLDLEEEREKEKPTYKIANIDVKLLEEYRTFSDENKALFWRTLFYNKYKIMIKGKNDFFIERL